MSSKTRSTTFDVTAPVEQYQAILNSIRRYRAACRELFAVFTLTQAAGAEIIETPENGLRLTPDSKTARAILSSAMGKHGKALGYEMRDWFRSVLYPGSLSFVWDSARRDMEIAWKSPDQEFPKARRGWMVLQGARGIAQFQRRGIGFPFATGRPKLSGHTLRLKWDAIIGPVEFALPRLDGGRYHVWRSLRDGTDGWKIGTLWLSERKGRLIVTISHDRPTMEASVDAERTCTVRIIADETRLCTLAGPEGERTFDVIDSTAAVAHVRQLAAVRADLESRRAAYGNSRAPWGDKKGFNGVQTILSRATARREHAVSRYNHSWTRRIVSRAVSWRCGRILLSPRPEGLAGSSWPWAQFQQFLFYKSDERGIILCDGSELE